MFLKKNILKAASFTFALSLGAGEGASFNANEQAAIKGIFDDKIDMSKTCKILDPRVMERETPHRDVEKIKLYASTNRHTGCIRFYDGAHSSDYSRETDIEKTRAFWHELTHVQQLQTENWGNLIFGAYNYDLGTRKVFDDFTADQQAAIIEDYTALYHRDVPDEPRYAMLSFGMGREGMKERLMEVVENKFPQARVTRLARTPQKKEMKPCP